MLRFVSVIVLNIFLVLHFIIRMSYYEKSKKVDDNFRYNYARKILTKVIKRSRVTVNVTGLENLDKLDDGYVLYANHQGKFDALAVYRVHERQLSVVIDEKKSHGLLVTQFLKLVKAKRLEKDNFRQGISLFKEIGEEVKEGKNFLIFPEGKYEDNKNTLQEFHTGCIKFLLSAKCPIVPVTLWDTYKVYGENNLKKVTCSVNFLPAIYYDEYKDLNKIEIAELLKSRIQAKLDELGEKMTNILEK